MPVSFLFHSLIMLHRPTVIRINWIGEYQMTDIIGFVYSGNSCSEITRSILQYAVVYQVPVVAISFPHLMNHFHGKELIADFWNGESIASFETSLPQILDSEYNFFTQKNLQQYGAEFTEWLKKRDILVQTSVKKEAIPQILLPTRLFPYLIPTWSISSYPQLLRQLTFVKDAVLKPSGGRQGKGISKLSRQNDGSVILQDITGQHILTEAVFLKYLTAIREQHLGDALLLQPFLDFSLDETHAVDFRLLRHRGISGEWEEAATYARIGASSLVSNISQGGYIADAKEILYQIAGDNAEDIYKEIMRLIVKSSWTLE